MAQFVECRSCGATRRCQEFTLHTKDVVSHDEGRADMDVQRISGQCDDCLKAHGPDEDCVGAIRAEREYRDFNQGEL